MTEIADDPRYRAIVGIENTTSNQVLQSPENIVIPNSGDIPVNMCLDPTFPFASNMTSTHFDAGDLLNLQDCRMIMVQQNGILCLGKCPHLLN